MSKNSSKIGKQQDDHWNNEPLIVVFVIMISINNKRNLMDTRSDIYNTLSPIFLWLGKVIYRTLLSYIIQP